MNKQQLSANSRQSSFVPNHNDAQIYHIFEGLMLLGIGAIFLITRGEGFGLSSYSDDLVFFSIAFLLLFAGVVRLVTTYYVEYFFKYAIFLKIILILVEGFYVLLSVTRGKYEYIPFALSLMVVNFVRLIVKMYDGKKPSTCFARFSIYWLALAVSSGIIFTLVPSTFPFDGQAVAEFIRDNQFIFATVWFLTFVPALLIIMSPIGKHTKFTSLFYCFGGLILLIFATEFAIRSRISLSYSSYIASVFVLFLAWWNKVTLKISEGRSFILLLGLVWVCTATLLGLMSFKAIQERTKEQRGEKLLTNLISVEDNLRNVFENNATLARRVIQSNPVLTIATNKDTEAAISVARQVYDAGNYLRGVNFIDKEGVAIGNYPRNSLVTGTNFSSRDYFGKTKEMLKGQIGSFFVNVLGNPNVAQTEPFFENNDFAGLLAESIDLERYSIEVKGSLDNTSELTVVDKDKTIVISSRDPRLIGQKYAVEKGDKDINISKDSIIVHRSLAYPSWELYLKFGTDEVIEEVAILAVFLTILLVVNGFVSLVAVISVTVKQYERG